MVDITSANSTLVITIDGLYTSVPISGYSVDDAFSTEDVKPVETMMGVDGKLSGGYTPYPTILSITLQADSASNAIFDAAITYQEAKKTALKWSAVLAIPGTGMSYTLTKGFLTGGSKLPAGKKVLQPRHYQITVESCTPAPI